MSNQNKATEEAGKIGHTPGPWRAVANESYWEVRASEDFGSVADTCSSSASAPHYGRSWALGEANAHLIASSPDLYEACKKAQALLNDICRPAKGSENMPSLMSRGLCVSAELSAAIYKATNGVSQ